MVSAYRGVLHDCFAEGSSTMSVEENFESKQRRKLRESMREYACPIRLQSMVIVPLTSAVRRR